MSKDIVVFDGGAEPVEIVFVDGRALGPTQSELAQMLGVGRSVVTKHADAVVADGVLPSEAVCALFARTASDGKTYQVKRYTMEGVIAIALRTRGPVGFAYQRLVIAREAEYIRTGSVVDEKRLSSEPVARAALHGKLARATINDVRSTVFAAMTKRSDYRRIPHEELARIAAEVTNGFLVTSSGMDASQLKYYRSDPNDPSFGMHNWRGDTPVLADALTGTSYLTDKQVDHYVRVLNMIALMETLIGTGRVADTVRDWADYILGQLQNWAVPVAEAKGVTKKVADQKVRRGWAKRVEQLPAPTGQPQLALL